MSDSKPLIFYDISSPIEPRSYAPNPSKGRLALSFKAVPFETTFVEIIEIKKVRQGLHCSATRKFDDGMSPIRRQVKIDVGSKAPTSSRCLCYRILLAR